LLAAHAAQATHSKSFPFSVCSGAPTDLSIATVQVSPDPPVSGQNISVVADGTVDEQLQTGSLLVISVSYMGVDIFSENLPMQEVTKIPVGPGPITIFYAIVIPSGVPHGQYQLSLTFNDQSGTEITCIALALTL
jgi:hypothetical protein